MPPKTRTSAAAWIKRNIVSSKPSATKTRPVWPRAVRVIMPIVSPPIAPMESAWVAWVTARNSNAIRPRSSRCTTIHAYAACSIHTSGVAKVRHGFQSANRAPCKRAPVSVITAITTGGNCRRSAVKSKIIAPSANFSTSALRVALLPGTPLLVNIGITRPPMTAMMNNTTSSASCRPSRGVMPASGCSARCTTRLSTPISTSNAAKK